MDIKELKNKIEKNRLDDQFLVFILEDDTSRIITDQYIRKICKNRNLNLKFINSIQEIPDDSFIQDDNLYVIMVDKWESIDTHSNCIVVCKESESGIRIPKVSDWHLIDYIKSFVSLDDETLRWLVSKHHCDQRDLPKFNRLLNDMNKLKSFNKKEQKEVLEEMIDDGTFDDLTNKTIFDVSNAIIRNEKQDLINALLVRDYYDCDPLPLITILYKQYKQMLMIMTDRTATAEKLGVSDKQFYIVKKYNCSNFTVNQLVKSLEIISKMEYMYKFGGLNINSYDQTKDQVIEYLIIKLLGVRYDK